MKTNKLITLALLASVALLFSCKSKTSETATPENPAASETSTPKGKYAIKSGIVQYKTEMMGMEVMQTLTFDNYGKKEATDVEMEMMGVKVHTVNLTKDGFIYNLDMVKKTGTKSPEVNIANASIDFENLTEEMVKEMELKKLGTEEFLGKTCEKMSIDNKKMGMKGTFLVYKGVALKSETDLGSMKMNLLAEKFEENPTIPAEKFEVPSDIKIMESN